ncbi:MAG TPA: serine hydrolase domain-containing protein [Puia sp.]|nr:serine hydrolase domain-containing protein [Puia sp.]
MRYLSSQLTYLILIFLPGLCFSQSFIQIADSIRKTRGIPAIAYAVCSSDSIFDAGVCGFKKFATRDSIHMLSRFDIGTNTAAFTSYIAAQMVQKGKIKWNTKLLDVFPEFKKKAFPVYQNITLLELLSNQTRLQPLLTIDDWTRVPPMLGNTMSAKRRAFTLYMLQQKPYLENVVSKKIVYSVAGYVIAASMLEKVAHKKWENLIVEYINTPLKIVLTPGFPFITKPDSTVTFGHWFQGNYYHYEDASTWLRIDPVLDPGFDANINLPDYIKFVQENLKGLTGKNASLSQTAFEFIHYGVLDYSLGWYNGSFNNNSFSFHEGVSPLYDCRVEIIKEKNIGIIVMCNSGDKDGRGGVLDLIRLLEGYYFHR